MNTNLLAEALAELPAATTEDIVPELEKLFRTHRSTLERRTDSVRAELVSKLISMASNRMFLRALLHDARYSELCCAAVMELDASMSAPDPAVRWHIHSIASGRIERPKGKRGPKRCWDRELCIISAVAWCVRCGLYAERYDGAEHECGCSLVAQALERAGIRGLGEANVRKIWSRRPRLRV
jgi:hypothetical protein